MEQYLDEKDGKWHIAFSVKIPKITIKNKLNFRIKEITLQDGTIVLDPQIDDSKYIFQISQSMIEKNIFFNFNFNLEKISNISEFKVGLCDEMVRWFNSTIVIIKNDYFKNLLDTKSKSISLDLTLPEETTLNLEHNLSKVILPKEEQILKEKIQEDILTVNNNDNILNQSIIFNKDQNLDSQIEEVSKKQESAKSNEVNSGDTTSARTAGKKKYKKSR